MSSGGTLCAAARPVKKPENKNTKIAIRRIINSSVQLSIEEGRGRSSCQLSQRVLPFSNLCRSVLYPIAVFMLLFFRAGLLASFGRHRTLIYAPNRGHFMDDLAADHRQQHLDFTHLILENGHVVAIQNDKIGPLPRFDG